MGRARTHVVQKLVRCEHGPPEHLLPPLEHADERAGPPRVGVHGVGGVPQPRDEVLVGHEPPDGRVRELQLAEDLVAVVDELRGLAGGRVRGGEGQDGGAPEHVRREETLLRSGKGGEFFRGADEVSRRRRGGGGGRARTGGIPRRVLAKAVRSRAREPPSEWPAKESWLSRGLPRTYGRTASHTSSAIERTPAAGVARA